MSGLPPLRIQTIKHKGTTYRVQLFNQWLAGSEWKDGKLPDVYWLATWQQVIKQSQRVTGVRLDDYLVTRDDDPTWRALIGLQGETILQWQDDNNRTQHTQPLLKIARVTLQLGAQVSSALPLDQLLSACIRVGTIAGHIHPDNTITAHITDTGQFIAPDELDELMGIFRERRPAKEQHELALHAAIEFKKFKLARSVPYDYENMRPHTIDSYVSVVTGIADGKTLLREARKDELLQDLATQSYIREEKK